MQRDQDVTNSQTEKHVWCFFLFLEGFHSVFSYSLSVLLLLPGQRFITWHWSFCAWITAFLLHQHSRHLCPGNRAVIRGLWVKFNCKCLIYNIKWWVLLYRHVFPRDMFEGTTEKIFEEKKELYDVYIDNQNVKTHRSHLQQLLRLTAADKEKYRKLTEQRCVKIVSLLLLFV